MRLGNGPPAAHEVLEATPSHVERVVYRDDNVLVGLLPQSHEQLLIRDPQG
jgi:hypothetical protein